MPLEVEGYEEFQEALATFRANLAEYAEIAGDEARMVFEQGLMILQGEAADYPPQDADANYRRTGTLGRTWISAGRVISGRAFGSLVGRVGNRTPYGPYVQDPDQQAWFHEGVWTTTEDVARENRDAIEDLWAASGLRITRGLLRGIL